MQDTLIDILVLGLLVLLFASTHRKAPTRRLRYWIIGWLSILLHFAVLLYVPHTPLTEDWVFSLQAAFLVISGVAFILACSVFALPPATLVPLGTALLVPALTYVFMAGFKVPHHAPYLYAATLAELAAVWLTWRFIHRVNAASLLSFAAAAAGLGLAAWSVLSGHPERGIYVFLTQLFLVNAVLFWQDFHLGSAGVLTAMLGLLAWAAVFPAALLLAVYRPSLQVPAELWNVPKYFVEFGMVLTLLEEELRQASRQREDYKLMFDGNPHPMWIYSTSTLRFLRVNRAAIEIYGYTREEFLGMDLRQVRPDSELARFESLRLAPDEIQSISGPWTHRRKDGTVMQVEVSLQSLVFDGTDARLALIKDITERQTLLNQLVYQTQHDILTGLPNRLLLRDRMEQTLLAAARDGHKAAVLCLDLDRFKQINDTYGHAIGDICLKQVAQRLCAQLRQVDTVARTGGEEFTVVLGGLHSMEDAERLTAGLLQCFGEPCVFEGFSLDLSASFGVALYPDDGTDADTLWRAADTAMYRAKNLGGNQYLFVSPEISSSASEANEIERHLRRALKDGGCELYYQPQCTLDGEIRGLEALVRLRHPQLGILPAGRFITIAEESGLILPLGNWVLEEVCRQIVEWERCGLPRVRVALNVSPLQFIRLNFAVEVQHALERSHADPHSIELEVTESVVMRNMEDVARQMETLSALGVRLSVDDFGTGYSSLRHLHQLPIQTLKIDRSFTERIDDKAGTLTIVQATLSLAHSLGMNVIAEGVETVEQLRALRTLGCDLVQGFLYSRAVPAAEAAALIRAGRCRVQTREERLESV